MSLKARLMQLVLLTTMLYSFSGCSMLGYVKEEECPVRTEYIDREVEVYITKKCIVPRVDCSPKGTSAEKTADMSKCILDFIESAKVCQ